MVDYFVRWWFGCFIPGTAVIGDSCSVGYGGIGVVIHKDAILGARVEVGPNVVIGGDGVRYGAPKIGSNVVIGAGAKILGPITIGNDVRVGANAVVISDIPDRCLAVGVPARARRR